MSFHCLVKFWTKANVDHWFVLSSSSRHLLRSLSWRLLAVSQSFSAFLLQGLLRSWNCDRLMTNCSPPVSRIIIKHDCIISYISASLEIGGLVDWLVCSPEACSKGTCNIKRKKSLAPLQTAIIISPSTHTFTATTFVKLKHLLVQNMAITFLANRAKEFRWSNFLGPR